MSRHPHFHKSKIPHREAIGAKTRAACAQIVNSISEGISLTDAFPRYTAEFDARDCSFIKEIVYGTLRNRRLLMTTLHPLFDYKITERHRIVQALLLTAFYQICFMRVPPHAVVASTVSACAMVDRKSFTALVNAILRRFMREGSKLVYQSTPAVKYSFPDWLCDHIQKSYPNDYERVLSNSNEHAPLFLRVELSKISLEEYLNLLDAKDIDYALSPICDCTVRLMQPMNVSDIPGFAEGLCSVQDVSAQLSSYLLDLDKDSEYRVLDCCCSPGGKTAHIFDLAPKSQVVALDVDESRLKQTQDTLSRLNRSAELICLDAQDLSSIEGSFDRILVDAPCSGTGVIRRHPDIKWLRRAKDIKNLTEVQAKILDAAFSKLKSGGILLYTTCSILPEENIEQVKAFLERHGDAKLKSFTLKDYVKGEATSSFETLQRLPGEHEGDGFFYARFVKA